MPKDRVVKFVNEPISLGIDPVRPLAAGMKGASKTRS